MYMYTIIIAFYTSSIECGVYVHVHACNYRHLITTVLAIDT